MPEPKELGGTAERGGPGGEVSTSATDALDNLHASDPGASSKHPESAMSDAVDEAQDALGRDQPKSVARREPAGKVPGVAIDEIDVSGADN